MDFKVFTLNCWGIAMISKDRKARMQAIAEMLARSNYDVVCLQEIWIKSDYELIRDKASGVLPYSHYFFSGVTGSGVCILSRHPIDGVFFHQWSVNGYIHKLHHGDWFGGKGVGLCILRVNNYKVNVYSAHLHAEYDRDCDEYQAHRVLQAFDTAQFIHVTSSNADLIVLAGDLNSEPGDLAYRVMLSVPDLVDAYSEADEAFKDMVATNEAHSNSYTPQRLIKAETPGKRIDYIMYHPGRNLQINLKEYSLPLPARVPESLFSYSDHEAVSATLVITKTDAVPRTYDLIDKTAILNQCLGVCNDALRSIHKQKIVYWFFTFVLSVLLATSLIAPAPFNFTIVFNIFKVFISLFMFYTLIMATLWNNIERNAIIAGILGMEVTQRQVRQKGDL